MESGPRGRRRFSREPEKSRVTTRDVLTGGVGGTPDCRYSLVRGCVRGGGGVRDNEYGPKEEYICQRSETNPRLYGVIRRG